MFKKYKKNSRRLQKYASKIIPGTSQLFGKRPELYLPGGAWPTYYSKAKGVNVWGLDNKKYHDFTMVGIGTSVLGYSDPSINKVAIKALNASPMNTLNPPEDVELAEILLKIHPWAEGARFCRTGGETMSIAIRLARAYSKREKILFCGYHGWHDWYLAANLKSQKNLNSHLLPGLEPLGVPKGLQGLVIPFKFNDFDDIKSIVKKNAKNCAAIVMEPCRESLPKKGYLKEIKRIAKKENCVLIFDEITSGWRSNTGGIHMKLGVYPDIAVFGKTIANGFAMGAIIGKNRIMKNATKTFISSAFWTERIGPSCAVAFIKKHKRLNLGNILIEKGKKIKNVWKRCAYNAGLDIEINGIDPLPTFKLVVKDWPATLTFFIQEMLKNKFLATDKCYANYKHDNNLIKKYEKACLKVFQKIYKLNKSNNIRKNLESPIKLMGFKRLTN
tara:strand:- start:78483 stop:79814 length:1332 start_codon:yes stop_codon:yes gene_type:complete